jgi:hypothetical protein
MPVMAQMSLKFISEASTKTSASLGPGVGVGKTSSFSASTGSPCAGAPSSARLATPIPYWYFGTGVTPG